MNWQKKFETLKHSDSCNVHLMPLPLKYDLFVTLAVYDMHKWMSYLKCE